MKKISFLILALGFVVLGACNDDGTIADPDAEMNESSMHEDMDHSSSGEVPKGIVNADSPTFPPGSDAVIRTNHMKDMDGAEAVVSGAYDTTVYSVSYQPTTDGDEVWNHKWVVHEELEGVGNEPLEPGSTVTLNADHMKGMEGAEATIETAKQTTVYMVDFRPTSGGEMILNHKWVTEDELNKP